MLEESSNVLILIIIFMMSEMYSALVIKISNYKNYCLFTVCKSDH